MAEHSQNRSNQPSEQHSSFELEAIRSESGLPAGHSPWLWCRDFVQV